MGRRTAGYRTLAAAGLAMALAVAVYCLGRSEPPLVLEPFHYLVPAALSWQGALGSVPSLLYTLSLALIIGAAATARRAATIHVLLWTALAMTLELGQHPALARPVGSWLQDHLAGAAWQGTSAYWLRGTFDYLDLLATLLGGLLGLLLLNQFRGSVENEHKD